MSLTSLSSYSDGTSSITSNYTIEPSTYLYKIGKVVFLFLYLVVNASVSSSVVLATIPSGYKPVRQVFCMAHLFGGGTGDGVNAFIGVNEQGSVVQQFDASLGIKKIGIIGSWYTED